MKKSKHHHLPMSCCPTCGHQHDCAASAFEDTSPRPTPGDFNLCIKCGEICCYTEALTTRIAQLNDLMALDARTHQELKRCQDLIRRLRPLG